MGRWGFSPLRVCSGLYLARDGPYSALSRLPSCCRGRRVAGSSCPRRPTYIRPEGHLHAAVQLHRPAGALPAHGRALRWTLLATWENYSPEPPAVYFPIYESKDAGVSWSLISKVADQVNGWGPAVPAVSVRAARRPRRLQGGNGAVRGKQHTDEPQPDADRRVRQPGQGVFVGVRLPRGRRGQGGAEQRPDAGVGAVHDVSGPWFWGRKEKGLTLTHPGSAGCTSPR